jgi:hypothetical protein
MFLAFCSFVLVPLLWLETMLIRFHLTHTQAMRLDAWHPGFALNGLHQGRLEKFGLEAM